MFSISVFSQNISIDSRCSYTLSDTISKECQDNSIFIETDTMISVSLKRSYVCDYECATIYFVPYCNRIYEMNQYQKIKNDKDYLKENMKYAYVSRLYKIDSLFRGIDSLRKFEPTRFNGVINEVSETIYDYHRKVVSDKYPDTVYVRIVLRLKNGEFFMAEQYIDYNLKNVLLPLAMGAYRAEKEYREEVKREYENSEPVDTEIWDGGEEEW